MIAEFFQAFISLFLMINPLGHIPIYAHFAEKMSVKERYSHLNNVVLIAAIILIVFLFLGQPLLRFFGVTLPAFKVAGGLILLLLGMKFVLGIDFGKPEKGYEVASVPLATPIISGPGAITTAIILAGKYGYFVTLLAIVLNMILVWLVIRHTEILHRFLGRQGADVFTKIIGILIVAIGLMYIKEGWIHM
jgi:multiple antibiotic resistance protein